MVETSPRKRGNVPEYVCVRRRHNGTRTNTLHLPVTTVNEAVLHAIEAHVFTPPAIEQMVSLTGRDDHRERQATIARELQGLTARIGWLVAAVEQ